MRHGSRRPRVLVITENVPLARDHRLDKQVVTLVENGFAVTVICRRDPGNADFPGVRVLDYPAPRDAQSRVGYLREYGWSGLMAALLMLRAAVRPGFDAVQVCGAPDIYFPLARIARRFGKYVVYDQRDPSPELYLARYGNRRSLMWRVLLAFERATYATAHRVITVNESLRRTAQQRGGVPDEHVVVVGNGPRLSRVQPQHPDPSLKRGRRFLCCWHGMMGPQDALDHALRAVAHVVHGLGRTDCSFVFVGDGDARSAAEALAAELHLEDFVVFPGWLPEQEVFRYLATADVALEPNLEEIVSPVKVMEYLAFGVPVAAFDVAETRALASDAAVYAPPGDDEKLGGLLDDLLADAPRRARLGAEGRRRVRTSVAWDLQAPIYVSLYRRLLGLDRRGDSDARAAASASGPTDRHVGRSLLEVPHA